MGNVAGRGNEENKKVQIMGLNFISKSLQGRAGEFEKEIKAEKLKVKRAIERRNSKEAGFHARNAVRHHKARVNYLLLTARLDAVVDRLNTRLPKMAHGKCIGSFLKSLESSLAAGNLQKLLETMDQFERQLDSLDVKSDRAVSGVEGDPSVKAETGSCRRPMARRQDNRLDDFVKAGTGSRTMPVPRSLYDHFAYFVKPETGSCRMPLARSQVQNTFNQSVQVEAGSCAMWARKQNNCFQESEEGETGGRTTAVARRQDNRFDESVHANAAASARRYGGVLLTRPRPDPRLLHVGIEDFRMLDDTKASNYVKKFRNNIHSLDDHEGYNDGVPGSEVDPHNAVHFQQAVDRVMQVVRSEQVADESTEEEVNRLMQEVADEFGLKL